MKQFTSHIDYLIQEHDCVIIPDFGGFVLSREIASIASDGTILPPHVVVGFNPDLKYNDGLLAESYMNVYSISYDTACKRIRDVVSRLNVILNLKQSVEIGHLGKLSLNNENYLTFIPNENLSLHYPDTFGFSVVGIKRLADIKEVQEVTMVVNKKRSSFQRLFTQIGAAAAAILVFFVTSTPVSENTDQTIQKSGFFTDVLATSLATPSNEITTDIEPVVIATNIESSIIDDTKATVAVTEKTEPIASSKVEPTIVAETKVEPKKEVVIVEKKKTATPKYYVIIGSASSKSEAQNVLKRLQNQGYNEAKIVNTNERSRIYISAFENKDQADRYLNTFKKNNPKLNDAWIFSKPS